MRALASFLAVALTLAAFAALPEDPTFLKTLSEGGRAEVQAGQIAATKGQSPAVRDFGMMMAKDHGDANKKVADVAKAKGVELPDAFSPEKKEMLDSLRKQSGPRFDSEYMEQMVSAHEKTVKLLEAQISGGSGDTKELAQELLPTVKTHLREAYRLTGQHDKAAALAEG